MSIASDQAVHRSQRPDIITDQVRAFFQSEVPDSQMAVEAPAPESAEPKAPTAKEANGSSGLDVVSHTAVTLQQPVSMAGALEPSYYESVGLTPVGPVSWRVGPPPPQPVPPPTLLAESIGFTPKPLHKCVPPSNLEDMRPPSFRPLDGKKHEVPVPSGTADLTKEWCTKAFRFKGALGADEKVTKLIMKPLGEGEGEFSELVLLAIEVNDGAKGAAPRLARHLVAKFSPPDLSAVELAQVFGTEAHFYNDTSVEAGGLNRPEALYVGYCKGSGCCGKRQYCIIMESAAGTREAPTVCYKRVDGCNSPHHMRLAMRSLARFHARWWQHPQASVLKHYSHPFTAGGPLPKFPSCIAITAWMLMFKNGLKALPHCFSTHPKYDGVPKFAFEYAQFIMELRPVLRRRRLAAVREMFREPLTLVHGDAHLENVFFSPEYEGGCTWIDFGLTMLGQPLGDVSTIIAGGMPVEARREHEHVLVRCYHEALHEFGVTGYDFERCWQDYTYQIIKPFFQLLIMAPGFAKERKLRKNMFSPNPSVGSQKLALMYQQLNTRISTALTDHKWKDRIGAMKMTAGKYFRPCQ
jgi:hypothetical protein